MNTPLPPTPNTSHEKNTVQHRASPSKKQEHYSLTTLTTHVLLPALLWFFVWLALATHINQEFLLPSPLVVAQCLAELMATEEFWLTLAHSFRRISMGLLGGTVLGVVLATLTFFSPMAHLLLNPIRKIIQAIPVVSFILLVLLWTKRDLVPTLIAALMVLPLLWSSTQKGLEQTDPQLLQFAQAFTFSPWKKARLVYFPSVFPYFSNGLHNALSLAWKSGVAAEVICQPPRGIGSELHFSKLYLDTPTLFAWTVVIVLTSSLMELALKKLFPPFSTSTPTSAPKNTQETL